MNVFFIKAFLKTIQKLDEHKKYNKTNINKLNVTKYN